MIQTKRPVVLCYIGPTTYLQQVNLVNVLNERSVGYHNKGRSLEELIGVG